MTLKNATNKLTDTAVRNAKPKDKAYNVPDGWGLGIEVQPNGSKWWRLRFRFAGKEKMLSLGTYPEVSLKEARMQRDRAREALADGLDPSEVRKNEKSRTKLRQRAEEILAQGGALPGTFEAVAREWLGIQHEVKVSPGHAARTKVRLEQNIFPWLGRTPIDEITPPALLQCLRRIEDRGAVETAHRVKDACAQVFRYGIATGAGTRNPASDLKEALRPVIPRHHAAIVEPEKVAELLKDIASYEGQPVTKAALKLSALLLLRPGELRSLEWTWVDLDTQTLTIPAERMKRSKARKANGAPHIVPLAPQAIELLSILRPLTKHSRFVFPALTSGQRCMSENTVRSALRRLGYANDEMTAHGFRAMARTMLAERLGVRADVIEAQLAHEVPDALGRAYNRTQFLEQRREMMIKWADYLDQLQKGSQEKD